VGDAAAENIISESKQHTDFLDFVDFLHRIDLRLINKRVLECLILSGAFDSFGVDRNHLMESSEVVVTEALLMQKDRAIGQTNLFDRIVDEEAMALNIDTSGPLMSRAEKLRHEKALLGFYVSGHPLDEFSDWICRINYPLDSDVEALEDGSLFRLCGVVNSVEKRIRKKDNRPWATFSLETMTKQFSFNCFPDTYEAVGSGLIESQVVVIVGVVRKNNDEIRYNVSSIDTISDSLKKIVNKITFKIDCACADVKIVLNQINSYIQNNSGSADVILSFKFSDGQLWSIKLPASLTCCASMVNLKLLLNNQPNLEIDMTTIAPFIIRKAVQIF
jgi:DNA polymerase-3 subunit alpha